MTVAGIEPRTLKLDSRIQFESDKTHILSRDHLSNRDVDFYFLLVFLLRIVLWQGFLTDVDLRRSQIQIYTPCLGFI